MSWDQQHDNIISRNKNNDNNNNKRDQTTSENEIYEWQ